MPGRMGEMLREIPKASGARTDLQPLRLGSKRLKPKADVLSEAGITKDAASQYQQMAAHPDIVAQAIEEALKTAARGHQLPYKARYLAGVGFGIPWETRPYTALHNGL